MQSRRSKVVPDPLVYPDKTTHANSAPHAGSSAASGGTAAPAKASAAAAATAVRPRLFRVASPAAAQPSTTPMSGLEPFSPGLNVYRGGGAGLAATIPPKTRVLVDHHVTNTGAVVRLEQLDYSKAMRAYRVCRQEGWTTPGSSSTGSDTSTGSTGHGSGSSSNTAGGAGGVSGTANGTAGGPALNTKGGPSAFASVGGSSGLPAASPTNASATSTNAANSSSTTNTNNGGASSFPHHMRGSGPAHSPAPWRVVLLRLFSATDMVLLAIAVACFLVVVSRLRGAQQAHGGYGNRGYGHAHHNYHHHHHQSGHGDEASVTGAVPWVLSMVSGLFTGGHRTLERADVRVADSVESQDTPSAPTTADGGSTGALTSSASYTQVTHAASLDTSVTFGLLFFSVLLLAKRLSSAFARVYVEEVLVMRGVGLQFSSYGIFNTLRYKIFVDLQMLRSLVIHDAFFRYQPMFYLSSSVENRAERMVYFPDTLPRLAVLRPVLNGIRGVLYGEPEEGPSLAELEERWKTSSREISEEELLTEDSFAEDTVTTPDEGRSSDGTDHGEEGEE